jgi:hypothetical protein
MSQLARPWRLLTATAAPAGWPVLARVAGGPAGAPSLKRSSSRECAASEGAASRAPAPQRAQPQMAQP